LGHKRKTLSGLLL